jgi:hypothetical protein
MYNKGEVDEARQLELDYVEEARCTALVQSPAGDPAISRSQHERTVVQYRRFGPTLHPR